MTVNTELVDLSRYCKRVTRPRCRMATLALRRCHRLVNVRFEQRGIIGRVDTVALTTATNNRVIAMLGDKTVAGQTVAILTEVGFCLNQQFRLSGPVSCMTGFTPLSKWRMQIFTGVVLLIMTIEADLVALLTQKVLIGGIMRLMATIAQPCLNWRVQHRILLKLCPQLLMAEKTKIRDWRLKKRAADKAMLAVATGTILFSHRCMYVSGRKFLFVFSMTIEAGFAALGGR